MRLFVLFERGYRAAACGTVGTVYPVWDNKKKKTNVAWGRRSAASHLIITSLCGVTGKYSCSRTKPVAPIPRKNSAALINDADVPVSASTRTPRSARTHARGNTAVGADPRTFAGIDVAAHAVMRHVGP